MNTAVFIVPALLLAAFDGAEGVEELKRELNESAGTSKASTDFDFLGHALTTADREDIWIPLIGMTVFLLGGLDDGVSEWALDENPIFGSASRAQEFSDIGRDILVGGAFLCSLVKVDKPAKSQPYGSLSFDFKGAVNFGLGKVINSGTTELLKKAIGRERPDAQSGGASPYRSLPSGHTSSAFFGASVIKNRLGSLDSFKAHENIFVFGLYGLAGAVSWARIEGGRHWTSDVLFGAAIGNFFGNYFPVGKKPGNNLHVSISPYGGGLAFGLHSKF